jgi:cysteine desulfuration protein SufE
VNKTMSELPPKLQEVLDTLEMFPDRADRIQVLISFGDRFRPVPEEIAKRPFPEEHRVPGCESEAYVWAVPRPDGTQDYHFAVENPQGVSAMAMAAILRDSLSGQPLATVQAVPPDIIYQIFGRELSMGKSMGLMGMVQFVHALARRAEQALPRS